MTGLQNGSPARALAPQNYSNSAQDTSFQDATGGVAFQSSQATHQTLQSTTEAGTLRVVGSSETSSVLGVGSGDVGFESPATNNQQNVFTMSIVALLCFALFWYCLKMLWKTATTEERHDEEN